MSCQCQAKIRLHATYIGQSIDQKLIIRGRISLLFVRIQWKRRRRSEKFDTYTVIALNAFLSPILFSMCVFFSHLVDFCPNVFENNKQQLQFEKKKKINKQFCI